MPIVSDERDMCASSLGQGPVRSIAQTTSDQETSVPRPKPPAAAVALVSATRDERGQEPGQAVDAADGAERAAVPDYARGDVLARELRLVLVEDAVDEVAGDRYPLVGRECVAHAG